MEVRHTALQSIYFTKECAGYEIESKWTLLTQNPIPTIMNWIDDIHDNQWGKYQRQISMGFMPVHIRLLFFQIAYLGTYRDGYWQELAKIVKVPGKNLFYFIEKEPAGRKLGVGKRQIDNPPLIRKESGTKRPFSASIIEEKILNLGPNSYYIGSVLREKCAIFITNSESQRNFNLSADLCTNGSNILSQIEIEYKGRNGIWMPDDTGEEILKEYKDIHNILTMNYSSVLLKTDISKFEWVLSCGVKAVPVRDCPLESLWSVNVI